MVSRDELVNYCNGLLAIDNFKDYCPNGLQVEGKAQITRIVAGVTASRALIEAAIDRGADALLVHHGYFWRGEDSRVVGMKRERLALLLQHGINLMAYHLPLDAHPEVGNNVGLGRALGFADSKTVQGEHSGLLWFSDLTQPLTTAELSQRIEGELDRTALHIDGGAAAIRRVAWCTGGAQGYLDAAADIDADAFISGEISEQTAHIARERGIHYFAAGHHATERFGARALLAHLLERFDAEGEFVDIANPA